MKEKYLQLVDKQIEKLSKEDFNLDAWKSSTIYLLTRIFGDEDPKIKEIDNMKIDYSSWSLRDSDAKYKPIETCKMKGREILEIARDEVELFGTNEEHNKLDDKLKDLLSGKDYNKLTSKESSEKERKEALKSLTKDKLIELVCSLY